METRLQKIVTIRLLTFSCTEQFIFNLHATPSTNRLLNDNSIISEIMRTLQFSKNLCKQQYSKRPQEIRKSKRTRPARAPCNFFAPSWARYTKLCRSISRGSRFRSCNCNQGIRKQGLRDCQREFLSRLDKSLASATRSRGSRLFRGFFRVSGRVGRAKQTAQFVVLQTNEWPTERSFSEFRYRFETYPRRAGPALAAKWRHFSPESIGPPRYIVRCR